MEEGGWELTAARASRGRAGTQMERELGCRDHTFWEAEGRLGARVMREGNEGGGASWNESPGVTGLGQMSSTAGTLHPLSELGEMLSQGWGCLERWAMGIGGGQLCEAGWAGGGKAGIRGPSRGPYGIEGGRGWNHGSHGGQERQWEEDVDAGVICDG